MVLNSSQYLFFSADAAMATLEFVGAAQKIETNAIEEVLSDFDSSQVVTACQSLLKREFGLSRVNNTTLMK